MDINIGSIIQVEEVTHPTVNSYLDAGWIILQTASESSPNNFESSAMIIYAVGWPKEKGEVRKPQQ